MTAGWRGEKEKERPQKERTGEWPAWQQHKLSGTGVGNGDGDGDGDAAFHSTGSMDSSEEAKLGGLRERWHSTLNCTCEPSAVLVLEFINTFTLLRNILRYCF